MVKYSIVSEYCYICIKYSIMIEIIDSIRKYNFWDNNPIDTGYPRSFYLKKISQYIGNNTTVHLK